MSKKENKIMMDPFQEWAHRWGRIGTLIALIYMISIPFIVLAYYKCMPAVTDVINLGTVSILLVYIPVGLSEGITYTPILGSSTYLAYITGNMMNLKLPVGINAMNIAKKQPNTPEGEAVAAIGIAVSSLMTMGILALATLFASFIRPFFELEYVSTAAGYLLPALFGSMSLGLFASSASGRYVVKGGVRGVVPALVIMSVICIGARAVGAGQVVSGFPGVFIILMLPVTIIASRIMWKKGKIQVIDRNELARAASELSEGEDTVSDEP